MVEYTQREVIDGRDYGLWLVTVLLLSMGGMLLLFSTAYIKDLNTLAAVPDAIWDAICGRPNPEGMTLPILLTATTLSFICAGGVYIWKQLRLRRLAKRSE